MDTLSLRTHSKKGSVVDKDINSPAQLAKASKIPTGSSSLTHKGLVPSKRAFLEFYINDQPLSQILEAFYAVKGSLLDNWTPVLGSGRNSKAEQLKIKQLLGKSITDKEILQALPPDLSENDLHWYMDKYREELSNPEVLIYCCSECGDYDCGGVGVTIDKSEYSILWTFTEQGKRLSFEFDKYQYFELFNRYMHK